MKYESVEHFIESHIRYKQHWKKKSITMEDAVWQELNEDTWLDGIAYAKGSKFKVFESENFGWVVFHSDSKTTEGLTPARRILKW